MKNLSIIMLLTLVLGVFSFVPSDASANVVVNAGASMKSCAMNSLKLTMQNTTRKVERYGSRMQDSMAGVLNTPENAIDTVKKPFKDLGGSTTKITQNVVRPINQAYGAIDRTLNGNIDSLLRMSEAMKKGESFSGYVYDGANKISKKVKSSDLAKAMNDVVAYVPKVSDIANGQSDLNSKKKTTNQEAINGTSNASQALSSIKNMERIAGYAGYDGFSVNGLIKDTVDFKSTKDFMNLGKTDLPAGLSTAIQGMNLASNISSFVSEGTGQIQNMQSVLQMVTSVQALQSLQDGVFTAMEASTQLVAMYKSITDIYSMFSDGNYSASSFKNSVKSAVTSYKKVKKSVGNIQKSANKLQDMAKSVEKLKNDVTKNINSVKNSFNKSADLADLFKKVGDSLPIMKPVVATYEKYIDVEGKAKDYVKSLSKFGTSTKNTNKVLESLKPFTDPAKDRLSGWGTDLNAWYQNKNADASSDIAEAEVENSQADDNFSKLKSNAGSFKTKVAQFNSNINFLKTTYAVGSVAHNRLLSLESAITKLPSSSQISKFATDGLGITQTSRTLTNAYRKLNAFNPDKLTKSFEGLSGQFEELSDIQTYLDDYNDTAELFKKTPQMVNALAGNIKNLGGFIKCFNIDPERIARDLLVRTQDRLTDKAKLYLWETVGKATSGIPFLMLPRQGDKIDKMPGFENPFKGVKLESDSIYKSTNFFTQPQLATTEISSIERIAGINFDVVEDIHPQAGLRFAGINLGNTKTIEDITNPVSIPSPDMSSFGDKSSLFLDYTDTMGAWKYGAPKVKVDLQGIEFDHGDFKAKSYMPFAFKCGFDFKKSFCWHWKWHSCFMIKKCYPVPYILPSCETGINYKEPTVHVEISPRAATSQIGNFSFLKDIPSGIKAQLKKYNSTYLSGAENPVPSAHVMGISPVARYMSKLGPFFGNHTMVCDLAPKWDKFEYIQIYGAPLPSIKIGMKMGTALLELKDWNKDWFSESAPLLGAYPAPLAALYASEIDRTHWNPRTFPGGITPSGETYPNFEVSRTEAYQYALPYEAFDDVSGIIAAGNLNMNKCEAGYPGDGSNHCIGDWGAILPRNGQVSTHNPRWPLQQYAQLGYRAYDRVLEGKKDEDGNVVRNIDNAKIADGTGLYGIGYENTDFSLEWPYKMKKREVVGTHPNEWQEGYFGKGPTTGGMVMTYWRDTSCCVKACCPVPGFKPGSSYPWGGGGVLRAIIKLEVDKWKITEVVQKQVPGEADFKTAMLNDPDMKKRVYKSCRKSYVYSYDANNKLSKKKKTKAECKALTNTKGADANLVDEDLGQMEIAYNQCTITKSEKVCMYDIYGIMTKANCLARGFSNAKCQQVYPEYSTMTACLGDGYSYATCKTLGAGGMALNFTGVTECMAVGNPYATCSGYGFSYSSHAACVADGRTAAECTGFGL